MRAIFKSKFTLLVLMIALISGVLIATASWLVSPHVAVGGSVAVLGSLIAIVYWRLRSALSTTNRQVTKVNKALEQLDERLVSQSASLSSLTRAGNMTLRSIENKTNATLASLNTSSHTRPAEGGFSTEKLSEIHDQYSVVRDQLSGQRALLQEIVVALDLQKH